MGAEPAAGHMVEVLHANLCAAPALGTAGFARIGVMAVADFDAAVGRVVPEPYSVGPIPNLH